MAKAAGDAKQDFLSIVDKAAVTAKAWPSTYVREQAQSRIAEANRQSKRHGDVASRLEGEYQAALAAFEEADRTARMNSMSATAASERAAAMTNRNTTKNTFYRQRQVAQSYERYASNMQALLADYEQRLRQELRALGVT